MKKVISILLTFLMLMSMSIGVFAALDTVIDIAWYGKGGNTTINKEQPGTKGKASTEKVWHLSNTASTDNKYARIYANMNFGAAVEKNGTRNYAYSVIQVNLKLGNNTKVQFRNENADTDYIAMPITDTKLSVGEWHTILMYIDYTNITEDNYFSTLPTSYIYIDGAYYSKHTPSNRAKGSGIGLYAGENDTSVKNRMFLYFETSTTIDVDVADIQWYTTDINPADTAAVKTARPAFVNAGPLTLVGSNNLVNLEAATTSAKIATVMNEMDTTATYNVISYDADTELAANAELVAGNAIALEKTVATTTTDEKPRTITSKTYAYYTVNAVAEPPPAPSLTINDGVLPTTPYYYQQGNGSTIAAANGLMGKEASDKVMKFTQPGQNGGITKEGRLIATDSDFLAFEEDGTKLYDYFVMDFNILPKNNVGFQFFGEIQMTDTISCEDFNQGVWNKVRVVIDYSKITDPNNTITPDNKADTYPTANVYVNGKHCGETDYMNEQLQGRFGMYPRKYYSTKATTFRFEIVSTTGTALEAYVDDLHAELTNTAPANGEAVTALPTVTVSNNADVSLVKNVITVTADNLPGVLTPNGGTIAYVGADGVAAATDINDAFYVYVKPTEGLHNTYRISEFSLDAGTATATNVAYGTVLLVAEKKGDAVIKVAVADAPEDGKLEIDYTKSDNENTLKAFLLDSLTSLKPFVKALEK